MQKISKDFHFQERKKVYQMNLKVVGLPNQTKKLNKFDLLHLRVLLHSIHEWLLQPPIPIYLHTTCSILLIRAKLLILATLQAAKNFLVFASSSPVELARSRVSK